MLQVLAPVDISPDLPGGLRSPSSSKYLAHHATCTAGHRHCCVLPDEYFEPGAYRLVTELRTYIAQV